ncbi:MAG: hypothetical protein J6S67_23545 [Methanobrevibacter sp.]|nr:hypothetical protein [Methanobrevibacter sp.]
MAYEKQTWHDGDLITEERMNHMEDGIAAAGDTVSYDEAQVLTTSQEKQAMDNMGILHSEIWRFKLENGETVIRRVLTYIDKDSNLVNEAIVDRCIVASDPNTAGFAQAGFAVAV